MKSILLTFCALILLLGRSKHRHTLTETEARQVATAFANQAVKDRPYEPVSGTKYYCPPLEPTKECWYQAVFRDGRWHLDAGLIPDGWHVSVSFKADGSDPKLENCSFAPG